MPYGKRLTWTGDLAWIVACGTILGLALAIHDQNNKASCERAEAVNDAYMKGFRAGQLAGIEESTARIEEYMQGRNEETRQP